MHLKTPSYLGTLHDGLHFSVGKRPPERPPEAPAGMQCGRPLIVFLYFSSRLNKPEERDDFIKACHLNLSWNLQGVSGPIVPLFSLSLNALDESVEIKYYTNHYLAVLSFLKT